MAADQDGRHDVARKRVLYDLPGTERVTVRQDLDYAAPDAGIHTLDLYYPPDWTGEHMAPAVLFVSGLSDVGAQKVLGCRINEMESFRSWGRLVAASGLIGVTYTTGADPAADTRTVLAHLAEHGGALGVDPARLGLWACSSHVPNALGLMMDAPQFIRCAVFSYGFMLDLDGSTGVADAQATWRFANPAAGRTVSEVPAHVPLFIARAGQDAIPHINESIDRFLTHALRRNLPVTLVDHPTGPHAFDLDDDSETTREIVGRILKFLEVQLSAAA